MEIPKANMALEYTSVNVEISQNKNITEAVVSYVEEVNAASF